MARSIKKGPFVCCVLVKKVSTILESGEETTKPIKTWSRRSVIDPAFIGFTFLVHNGRTFVPVKVVPDMVGYKLGQFSPTRLFRMHAGDRKTK